MLSSDALSQLSGLKKEIRAGKDTAQGAVKGTSGRFGFVTLDDGREVFLKPEQMDRVLHGDRVEVTVTQNDKEQFEGKLEKLIHSPLKQLAGRYCIKGKGHFVIFENQQHTRWVFVPPKLRANAKDGHYVVARVTQHPFETGKAQAKIIRDLGTELTAETAIQYTLACFQLFENFPKDIIDDSQRLTKQPLGQPGTDKLNDLRNLAFVTIDSQNTRDMDDALSINTTDDGWLLRVAIANPGHEFTSGSSLDNIALRRAQTVYFPSKSISMLPETLSNQRYSLLPDEDRLALVCELTIHSSGKVTAFKFEPALVQSKAKLSYQQVSALLNDKDFSVPAQLNDATPHRDQLLALHQCANALNDYRKQHQLVMPNRPDFMMLINTEGKLQSIEKLEKTIAHVIVEESMIATNQAAGEFLAEHNAGGLFIVHPGYREERRQDIEKLLKEYLGEDIDVDTRKLESFIEIVKSLQENNEAQELFSIQQRFLQGSTISTTPAPHFGLGAKYYATVTSPIRRYQDLYNQRTICQLLNKKKTTPLKNRQIEKLNETINNGRQANRFMEQWLITDFMEAKIGQTFEAKIALLTNQGVGVRLNDTGIEGFIAGAKEDKENPDKPFDKVSFNNQRMQLTWNDKPLSLDQDVKVILKSVDKTNKKLAFEWLEKF
jgi:VacB/RNase II family 3'-5' exoribonuclease